MVRNTLLPVNPADRANSPPLSYIWTQDILVALCGLSWSITYMLYIRVAYRDKSYGMPIVPL